MERLYEALELKKEDVFYDLGCGVGKRPAAIFWDDGMVDLWGFNGDWMGIKWDLMGFNGI